VSPALTTNAATARNEKIELVVGNGVSDSTVAGAIGANIALTRAVAPDLSVTVGVGWDFSAAVGGGSDSTTESIDA
jgi:hypothetical protein